MEIEKVPIEELFNEEIDDEKKSIFQKLKNAAIANLPEKLRQWTVFNLPKDEVMPPPPDDRLLDRLKFAIPTIEIAKAFEENPQQLSEETYRSYKLQMLDWDFCKALIMKPTKIACKIRGTIEEVGSFNAVVKQSIGSLLISCEDADYELKPNKSDDESESDDDRKRDSSTSPSPHPRSKRARYEALEKKMWDMYDLLHTRLKEVEKREERMMARRARVWQPPAVQEQPLTIAEILDGPPIVPFQVPRAAPIIETQGITCQKLNSEAWNNIECKEVTKRLCATPVFSALKINPILQRLSNRSHNQKILENFDETLGTTLHGLLKQRMALSDLVKSAERKNPQAAAVMKASLRGPFINVTNDLLQYVCAKRAEVFDERRKMFKPKTDYLYSELHRIPPTSTHLFDDEKLNEFIRQQGGFSKVFNEKFRNPKMVHKRSHRSMRRH